MAKGVDSFRQALVGFRRVTVDTTCCIYFIERKLEPVRRQADLVFELARRGDVAIDLPAISRLELMVHPLQSRDPLEMDRVRKFIERSPGVVNVGITEEVLLAAASVRAMTRLRAPDALVAASAAVHGSEAIVGNDASFESLRGVHSIVVWGAGTSYRMPEYIHMEDYRD
jgi:predicted nucleic acid-binding protein